MAKRAFLCYNQNAAATAFDDMDAVRGEELMEPELKTKGENSCVRESLFYIILLIAIFPLILGMISDYFCSHYLSLEEVSVLGLTGSVDTLLTAMVAVFAIGAQAVCAKDTGEGN